MFDPRYSQHHYDPRHYARERAWNEYRAGLSVPGLLVPPIGIIEGLHDAWNGKFQLPGAIGAATPPVRVSPSYASPNKPEAPSKEWSTAAKVGVALGGAVFLYLIFVATRTASRAAAPVATRLGDVAASYLPEPQVAPKKRRAPRTRQNAKIIAARVLAE